MEPRQTRFAPGPASLAPGIGWTNYGWMYNEVCGESFSA